MHRWPRTSKFMKGIIAKSTLAVTGAATFASTVAVTGALTLTGALTVAARILTTKNVGTAGTNVTAVEYGDGSLHTTRLTLAGVAATLGDNASLAGGALIYTFPAGPIVIHGVTMSLGISLTTGTPTTDTPEIALGTVIGSGANATLGAVDAGCEDILGPAVLDDIAGTAELLTKANGLKWETADVHLMHVNWADAFADVDDTAATIDGTVVVCWSHLPLS